MSQVVGFIEALGQKNLPFGVIHNLTVNGQLYDIGKYPLKGFSVGDYIQFSATNKPGTPFWKLTLGTVSKLPPPAGLEAPTPQAAAPSGSAFPTPPPTTGGGGKSSATQDTISRQAAANTAIAFMKVLIDTDSLPVAKSGAKDKKFDLMKGVLRELMNDFHMWSTHKEFDFGEPEFTASDLGLAELEDAEWQE